MKSIYDRLLVLILDYTAGMDELRLIAARIAGNSLVAAECASLTGAKLDADGVAECCSLDFLPQSAYLSTGLRCLAESPTLDELASQIAGMSFPAERFKVESLHISPGNPLSKTKVILKVANAIQAYPDLKNPLHRFLVVTGERGLWFGEILNKCLHSYQQHDRKPFNTSSSLPSRLARALVNLIFPTARSVLDPFCGTGSLLLEAQMLGLVTYGIDWNRKMVGMTRCNLEHFGYTAQVEQANALDCNWMVDAIVTDLPYGCMINGIDQPLLFKTLCHLTTLAPQAVYVAREDLSDDLLRAGYRQVQVFEVRKRWDMSRLVHLALRG
jgi:tRNA G10  N-methylase Trm11